MVRPEDFGKEGGLIHEAVVTGRKLGAGKLFWGELAHNEEFFRQVLRVADEYGCRDLRYEVFLHPKLQLEMVKDLNERRWGGHFSKAQFQALGEPPTAPKCRSSVAVVLDVGFSDVRRTFKEATLLARESCPFAGVDFDIEGLQFAERLSCHPGLKWRVVDFEFGHQLPRLTPSGLLDSEKNPMSRFPGSAVLWMAAYSPQWLAAMGTAYPYVWVPGIRFEKGGYRPMELVPAFIRRPTGGLTLQLRQKDDNLPDYAVPVYHAE